MSPNRRIAVLIGALTLVVFAPVVAADTAQASLAAAVEVVSAICVGGTFILVTLAGLQEVRRLTGQSPARGVAALTASFALGQLIGPLLTHAGGSALTTMQLPLGIATVALVASASILLLPRPPTS